MLHRMLWVCLAAGLAAGALSAALQALTTTPLILMAETYEAPAGPHAHDGGPARPHVHGGGAEGAAHGHGALDADAPAKWAPHEGVERHFYTSISTIGASFGFALMLVSAMVLAGAPITPRSGLAWAVAAFAATGLAPAALVAPGLPGAAETALEARQILWIGVAIGAAVGLYLALYVSTPASIAAGVVLVATPIVLASNFPQRFESAAPAELAAQFAVASLVVQAAGWATIGIVAGYVWTQSEATARQPA